MPKPRHPYAFCQCEGDNCVECLRDAFQEAIDTENFGDYLNILAMAQVLRQRGMLQ